MRGQDRGLHWRKVVQQLGFTRSRNTVVAQGLRFVVHDQLGLEVAQAHVHAVYAAAVVLYDVALDLEQTRINSVLLREVCMFKFEIPTYSSKCREG